MRESLRIEQSPESFGQLALPDIDTNSSDIQANFDDDIILEGSEAVRGLVVHNPVNNHSVEAEVFMGSELIREQVNIAPLNGSFVEFDVTFEHPLTSENDPQILHAAKVALLSFLRK